MFFVNQTSIGQASLICHFVHLKHIFEAFTQTDSSTSRKYGGTDLGLTISREFCALLGGKTSLKINPGQGSVFKVKLSADVLGNLSQYRLWPPR